MATRTDMRSSGMNAQTPTEAGRFLSWLSMQTTRLLRVAVPARTLTDTHPRSRPRAVGVVPADWEYMTNVAAKVHGDAWVRSMIGDGRGGGRRWT